MSTIEGKVRGGASSHDSIHQESNEILEITLIVDHFGARAGRRNLSLLLVPCSLLLAPCSLLLTPYSSLLTPHSLVLLLCHTLCAQKFRGGLSLPARPLESTVPEGQQARTRPNQGPCIQKIIHHLPLPPLPGEATDLLKNLPFAGASPKEQGTYLLTYLWGGALCKIPLAPCLLSP